MLNEQALHEHTAKVDLAAFEPGGAMHITGPDDPAIVKKICTIYQKIRPYLGLITWIPFIGAKVKAVINGAMVELDKVCPGS